MSLTTDPTDPELGHGADDGPTPQNKKYLVLSEEERAKGFIRPVRNSYRHVGEQPKYPLRDLTEDELGRYGDCNYAKFEVYPDEESPLTGRFWTQAQLDSKACGSVTSMGDALAETYARDPHFYGSTYCVLCSRHLPVGEFVWEPDGSVVGS